MWVLVTGRKGNDLEKYWRRWWDTLNGPLKLRTIRGEEGILSEENSLVPSVYSLPSQLRRVDHVSSRMQPLNILPHHHHPTPFDSCCPRTASGMDRCCMPALQAERPGSGQESVVFAKNQTINSGEKCYGTANSSLLLSSGSRYSVNCLRFPLKACIVLTLEGCCEE